MKKVYWCSRHELSSAQISAIREIHGEDVEVVMEVVEFADSNEFADYIRSRHDGFVYVVAPAAYYLYAALEGCSFGFFENSPKKRQGGTFGLGIVYHVNMFPAVDALDSKGKTVHFGFIRKAWENPDPMGDRGEDLTPLQKQKQSPNLLIKIEKEIHSAFDLLPERVWIVRAHSLSTEFPEYDFFGRNPMSLLGVYATEAEAVESVRKSTDLPLEEVRDEWAAEIPNLGCTMNDGRTNYHIHMATRGIQGFSELKFWEIP